MPRRVPGPIHDSDRDRRRSASVRIPGALGVLERPCVPATTSRPASVRAVRPATAIPSFVIFCARPPTPQGEPRPSSAPSTRAWSFAAATRRRSSPSPTNWCGPSSASLFGANLIATQLSITKLRASPRTPRAGSEPSRNRVLATGRRSKRADRGDRKLILPARRTSGFGARQ